MTLNVKQEQKLKQALQRERTNRLNFARGALLHANNEHYSNFAGEVPDFGDQATAAQLAELQNTLARRDAAAIRAIDDALRRLEERHFGTCMDCGDDIDFSRLSAQLTAVRCVPCQEHYDRTHAGEAISTL